jgi:hypothetical protein
LFLSKGREGVVLASSGLLIRTLSFGKIYQTCYLKCRNIKNLSNRSQNMKKI